MRIYLFLLMALILLYSSCKEESPVPKPKGYFRIKLPEKKYIKFDRICAYNFETPVYSRIDTTPGSKEPCWINIHYPLFDATLHLSYKQIKNNLNGYLEDTRTLTYKHTQKASEIEELIIKFPERKVYGLLYDVKGDAASSIQFFVTDSTKHFLRGALYFNNVPNYDSIKPVLEFLQKDIDRFIETLEWK
jgi:gliding motility-associated lipoprotein GldD